MVPWQHNIESLSVDGVSKQLSIEESEIGDSYVLQVTVLGQQVQGVAFSLFHALIDLRGKLEVFGIRLLCVGSRMDVWPSGMSLSMGGGRLVYKLTLGQPPAQSDLVNIFLPASIDEVGTVDQQRKFHEKWLAHFQDAHDRKGS